MVIGKNVVSIGAKAFYKTKNLKHVVIQAKNLKRVGKNAFSGIHKRAVMKTPKKRTKIYRKLIRKSRVAKTVKIK